MVETWRKQSKTHTKTLSHTGPSSNISVENFCSLRIPLSSLFTASLTPLRSTKSTWPLLTCSHYIVITSKQSSQVESKSSRGAGPFIRPLRLDRVSLARQREQIQPCINRHDRSPGLLPIRRRDASRLEQKMKADNFAHKITFETLQPQSMLLPAGGHKTKPASKCGDINIFNGETWLSSANKAAHCMNYEKKISVLVVEKVWIRATGLAPVILKMFRSSSKGFFSLVPLGLEAKRL